MQVVGARPQFVKLAPVSRAIEAANAAGAHIESVVVHTGQHYDPALSDVFFSELGIPEADLDLGVGSGSHGRQTARMLEGLEQAMQERRPDLVLTYGDTNSTLAATLAAAKLHVPLAHVEAGLRSFNRRMPEETNRLVADHLSDLLFAPTPEAMRNLEREGLADRARQVGDVMLDALRAFAPVARERSRVPRATRPRPRRLSRRDAAPRRRSLAPRRCWRRSRESGRPPAR
jgi:UDP-N-acetylglucosamine 2-epimerase